MCDKFGFFSDKFGFLGDSFGATVLAIPHPILQGILVAMKGVFVHYLQITRLLFGRGVYLHRRIFVLKSTCKTSKENAYEKPKHQNGKLPYTRIHA